MDRNPAHHADNVVGVASLSARRAWIEIWIPLAMREALFVALRKESVDRNQQQVRLVRSRYVALRKESVDRNLYCWFMLGRYCWSLSARRAWIEIVHHV